MILEINIREAEMLGVKAALLIVISRLLLICYNLNVLYIIFTNSIISLRESSTRNP